MTNKTMLNKSILYSTFSFASSHLVFREQNSDSQMNLITEATKEFFAFLNLLHKLSLDEKAKKKQRKQDVMMIKETKEKFAF